VGIKSFQGRNIFGFNNLNSGNISKTCPCANLERRRATDFPPAGRVVAESRDGHRHADPNAGA
jgi:hypothetical protein